MSWKFAFFMLKFAVGRRALGERCLKGSLDSCAPCCGKGYVIKVSLFQSNTCLDSKLLVVTEMFPSWPRKNMPSPLKHDASVEKCFLLWSYKKHLSIIASGKTAKKPPVWFSREALGSTRGITGFYWGQSSSTSSWFSAITRVCVRTSFLSGGGGRSPTTLHHCVLAAIRSSSKAPGRPPLHPAACHRALTAGRELFISPWFYLHRQRHAKCIPARPRRGWWHPWHTAFQASR